MEPVNAALPGFALRLPIVLAVALCACVQQGPAQPSTGFDPAVRSNPDAKDERLHRFEIVSRIPATWIDADSAANLSTGPLCADGENWEFVDISPKPNTGEVHEQRFPAGTVFSRVWRCADRYPGEITFARSLSVGDAQQQVRDALQSTGIAGDAAELVLFDAYGSRDLKYDLIEKLVGDNVADAIAACGERSLRLHAPVIGEWAKDDPSIDRSNGLNPMFFGLRIDCENGSPPVN